MINNLPINFQFQLPNGQNMTLEDFEKDQDLQRVSFIYQDFVSCLHELTWNPKGKEVHEGLVTIHKRMATKISNLYEEGEIKLTVSIDNQQRYIDSLRGPSCLLTFLTLGLANLYFWSKRNVAIQQKQQFVESSRAGLKHYITFMKAQQCVTHVLNLQREAEQRITSTPIMPINRTTEVIQSDNILKEKCYKVEHCKKYKLTPERMDAFRRSIDIGIKYRDRNYVFNHHKMPHLLVFSLLIQELERIFNGKIIDESQTLRHSSLLRNPSRNAAYYVEQMIQNGGPQNPNEMNLELCSADVYLNSTGKGKSELDGFFSSESGPGIQMNKNIHRYLLGQYIQGEALDKFAERIECLMQEVQNSLGQGSLVSIVVPKAKFDEVGFLVDASNKPITDNVATLLQNSQKTYFAQHDYSENPQYLDEDQWPTKVPKVNLVVHKLFNTPGVQLITHNTLDPISIEKLRTRIQLITLQARAGCL